MKTIVLLGLGEFNRQLIEELVRFPKVKLVLVDSERDLIEPYKDRVGRAYIADAGDEETLTKVVPSRTHAAVVDMGEDSGAAVVAVNHLRRMNVRWIIAKTDSPGFAETLKAVGASQVIVPPAEVAGRLAPPLLLHLMTTYVPISNRLVVAEVSVPAELRGKTMVTGEVRSAHRVNVVAIRKGSRAEYTFPDTAYVFNADDAVLVVGERDDISKFAGGEAGATRKLERVHFFRRLIARRDRSKGRESDEPV